MVAILEKSDAAGGFEQIIDFLSGSYIHHALTMNSHVYISCIKQFWNTTVVKRSGVVYLPNEEIFAGLARMGYEKPSTKLTFYKAFFSTQWKFFIHTILHSLNAKRTSWNEFSSAMASALICLSSGQRVGKGFSGVETLLFENMLAVLDKCSAFVLRVEGLENANVAQQLEIIKLKARVKKLERLNKVKSSKLRRLKKVVTTAATLVAAASTPISAAKPKVLKIAAAPAVSTRRRKGVDAIWRNQKSVYGLALVKRWKLLASCGVHVIILSTVQLFLLVER
nr:hypothetical protein [Tanacetum cinerariifolium]